MLCNRGSSYWTLGCSARSCKKPRYDRHMKTNIDYWKQLHGSTARTLHYAGTASINADPGEAHEAFVTSVIVDQMLHKDNDQPQAHEGQHDKDVENVHSNCVVDHNIEATRSHCHSVTRSMKRYS